MEGMTPYIDFADSKGPLLWLIYGIGYLLSPTSYLGVFWLSVLSYTVTFAAVWRTARFYVGQRESLLVFVIMPAMIFYRGVHEEVRAEDFCLPWICIGLYCTCRALMSSKATSIKKYAFWLGIGMAWCLLIKWNLFVLMGGMALVMLGVSLSRKRIDALLFGLIGIFVLILPFAIYFLWKGNMTAMIKEYFVNTFLITGHGNGPENDSVFSTILTNRMSACCTIMLVGIFAGIFLFCRRFRVSYWLIFTYVPFFIFLGIYPSISHYFSIIMPFSIFFLLTIVECYSILINRCPQIAFGFALTYFFLGGTAYNTRWSRFVFFPSEDQERWDEVQSVLRGKERPLILTGVRDHGYGILSHALPACKYWALQLNASLDMIEERHQAIKARKPDFVLVISKGNYMKETQRRDPLLFTILKESGYNPCHITIIKNGKAIKKTVPVYAKE